MPRRTDWIEFTLTIGCSLNCNYCPQPLLAKRYKESGAAKKMTMDTFKSILDHLPLNHVGVDFSGYADPCLHPQFIEFFQEARSRCEVVSLYTTFEGLSKEHYDILKTIPFENLSVHLPDVAEMVHVKWTDDYKKILRALVDDPPKCRVQDRMTVHGPLHPDVAFLEPVRVMGIQPRSGNVRADLSRHETPHLAPLKCGRGTNLRQNVCLPDGSVYLCCCDYGMEHNLGNLTTTNFMDMDIERLKLIQRQKNPDKDLLCGTCEFAVPLDHPM